jgi:alkanesulfonate monooxygenase
MSLDHAPTPVADPAGIEVLGMVATNDASETHGSYEDGVVDGDYLARFAQAHEASGFDRVLIGYSATTPDGFAVASHVLHHTERLKVLIAHRPGFVQPSVVARKLATLDQLSGGGRVAIHHISGGDEPDQRRDGDRVGHDDRYRRTAEFMTVLRAVLESPTPVDFSGEFYDFEGAFSRVKPSGPDGIPLYFGGASEAAVRVGAEHADVYMLWGEPLDDIAARIAAVRQVAAEFGRTPRFSLSCRPILADTEDAAWERAEEIRSLTAARIPSGAGNTPGGGLPGRRTNSTSVGGQRLRQQAAQAEIHDERLWYGVAQVTGSASNSTALVGTPAQVAEALLRYHDIGVDAFLIRGFDPLDDAVDYGRELIPLVRQGARAGSLQGAGVAPG